MNDAERLSQYPMFRMIGSEKTMEHGTAFTSSSQTFETEMLTQNGTLTEREGRQLWRDWNDAHVAFPDACVHELFEEQVARNPDAVAVVYKQRQLSYRELNQRANQVARYLRKRGVGPDILVGVCLERSLEMVIALFGVWKAGGAYIPLDPAYPQERLSFMVSDTGMKVLLTDEKCKNLFPSASDKAVRLDSDWPVIARGKHRQSCRGGDAFEFGLCDVYVGIDGPAQGSHDSAQWLGQLSVLGHQDICR